MNRVDILTPVGHCTIFVDESVENLAALHGTKRCVAITDTRVRRLYAPLFGDYDVIEIGAGEKRKTLQTVEKIYRKMLALETDRSCFVLGIGGGMVCDIAGFAASTYMRGIPFGFVPTTLLAQVDASIGGKNGVNLDGFKNIVGVFNPPRFVLVDFEFLKTLPQNELLCGAAEIVKHALIQNASLFDYLEDHWRSLLSLQRNVLEKAVHESIGIKSRIVRRDVQEGGERRKLNFGHTLGHAVEKTSGLKHGEAISIGMAVAADISVAKGMLGTEAAQRIKTLLSNMGLLNRSELDKKSLVKAVDKDKKRQDDQIHFVLLSEIGAAKVTKMSYRELEGYIHDLC